MIKPALRRVWRDHQTLQLGADPSTAVVIGGLDRASARLVETLDGSRDLAGVQAAAQRLGVAPSRADHLLAVLHGSGVLTDGAADHSSLAALTPTERDRLAPDVAAASIARPGPESGVAVLARRRRRSLVVHGGGRVGAGAVRLLAAAGIGSVAVADAATVRPADLSPAGLSTTALGARRQEAAARAARADAPSVRTRSAEPAATRPDLVVVAPDPGSGADPRLLERLLRDGVPHLLAQVRDVVGVVGPLVLPGRSSCSRCHDLHRADRDRGWASVAAQLRAPVRSDSPTSACDVVLAAAVAAHTVLQALAYLDGGHGSDLPPAVDGTLEVALADGSVRRRSWSTHPSCGCTWGMFPVRPDGQAVV